MSALPACRWLAPLLLALALSSGCNPYHPQLAAAAEPAAPPKAAPPLAHDIPPVGTSGLTDFGDPNRERLIANFRARQAGAAAGTLSIVQLGDSHTASDTFTSGLRRTLQASLGNAGIGWIAPMDIRGQSHMLVKVRSTHWQLTSSRTEEHPHFPLGGNIAMPTREGARIRIELRQPDTSLYRASFLVRQTTTGPALLVEDARGRRQPLAPRQPGEGWQRVTVDVRLPFSITAPRAQGAQLGGIWLEKTGSNGVIVSPVGTNGARQTIFEKWSPGWLEQLQATHADLIILAYGTNESFDDKLLAEDMATSLRAGIRQIRRALPDAAVLIVGIPDAMDRARPAPASCQDRRPAMHDTVRRVQWEVAREEKALFWDWKQAMGGACPMLEWQQREWVGKDLVHFTMEGYQESSRRFLSDFFGFLNQP
ncbi:GDSL-type esterase/lipase family protein [Kerstersia gyiorum]|uniref:GDSL-type esterase/lipase family protein n=1 Tax=Kerstersia gyiorum TaxID=206506 RepID=UPI0039E78BDE